MRKQLALVAVLLFGLACGGNSVVRRRHRAVSDRPIGQARANAV